MLFFSDTEIAVNNLSLAHGINEVGKVKWTIGL